MNVRQEDGFPLRVHLQKAATSFMPDADAEARLLSAPPLPTGTIFVWASFNELHLRRGRNESGPLRFTWSDIQAWQAVTGSRLANCELAALFAIEAVFFSVEAENKK